MDVGLEKKQTIFRSLIEIKRWYYIHKKKKNEKMFFSTETDSYNCLFI